MLEDCSAAVLRTDRREQGQKQAGGQLLEQLRYKWLAWVKDSSGSGAVWLDASLFKDRAERVC